MDTPRLYSSDVAFTSTVKAIQERKELTAKLLPEGYGARPEQVIIFAVTAWDADCPQHIPQRFEADDVTAALAERDERIERLEARVVQLRGTLGGAAK